LEIHDKLKAELWEQDKRSEHEGVPWAKCATAYLRESVHKATYSKIEAEK
jgi:hypothetical protein